MFPQRRKRDLLPGVLLMPASFDAINGYKIMWLYVFFDLPTNTKKQRHDAAAFRKALLKDGYSMMQFSVYARHCASYASAEMHIQRLKQMVPDEGLVTAVKITDKQFGDAIHFAGRKTKPPPPAPMQLELF